jgi:hypothetical protein
MVSLNMNESFLLLINHRNGLQAKSANSGTSRPIMLIRQREMPENNGKIDAGL